MAQSARATSGARVEDDVLRVVWTSYRSRTRRWRSRSRPRSFSRGVDRLGPGWDARHSASRSLFFAARQPTAWRWATSWGSSFGNGGTGGGRVERVGRSTATIQRPVKIAESHELDPRSAAPRSWKASLVICLTSTPNAPDV